MTTLEGCYLLHSPGGACYVTHMRGVFVFLTVVLVLVYFCSGAVPCLYCLKDVPDKALFLLGFFYLRFTYFFLSCIFFLGCSRHLRFQLLVFRQPRQ